MNNVSNLGELKRKEIRENVWWQLQSKTYKKFLIVKIRSKISYCAFIKGQTISELIAS